MRIVRSKPARQSPEYLEQKALFEWIRNPATLRQYPALKLAHCSLNGVRLSKAQAGKAKAAGMLAGVFDVRVPAARGGYHGLELEMKAGNNGPTPAQLEWGAGMEAEGYKVAFAWTWVEAKDAIEAYLNVHSGAN